MYYHFCLGVTEYWFFPCTGIKYVWLITGIMEISLQINWFLKYVKMEFLLCILFTKTVNMIFTATFAYSDTGPLYRHGYFISAREKSIWYQWIQRGIYFRCHKIVENRHLPIVVTISRLLILHLILHFIISDHIISYHTIRGYACIYICQLLYW